VTVAPATIASSSEEESDMPTSYILGRALAGCIVTLLLPASQSQSDQGAIEPRIDPCSVERENLGDFTFGAARELLPSHLAASTGFARTSLDAIDASAPWFRGTIVPFPLDSICRMESTVEARAPSEQLPGAVKNLRRTDQR
jgi:hypothetical protein